MNPQSMIGMPLFQGMTEEDILHALTSLRAAERSFCRDSVLMHAGGVTSRAGLVLSGSVTVESSDLWGTRTILGLLERGSVFAETYALLGDEAMPVDVRANEDCCVLFFDANITSFSPGRAWAQKMTANLLRISARRSLHLSQRSFHTSPKTIRGRVLAYLNSVALQKNSGEFDIPFDRQQLADYLNVERTALSKELGRMRREGFFTVRRNHFSLLKNGADE